ncbi:MAG: hypothetical protein ABIW82_15635 [Dokdonella sp.]
MHAFLWRVLAKPAKQPLTEMNKQDLGVLLAIAGTVLLVPAEHVHLDGGRASQNQLYKLDMDSGAAITTMAVILANQTITSIRAVTIDPTTITAYAVVYARA